MDYVTAQAMSKTVLKALNGMSQIYTWHSIVHLGLFALSMFLLIIYASKWQKSYSIYVTLIFVLVPVASLSTYMLTIAQTTEGTLIAQKLIYLGGCFLPYMITMAIMELCHIYLTKVLKISLLIVNIFMYASILLTEFSHLFYTSFSRVVENGAVTFVREYGPMHDVYVIILIGHVSLGVLTVIYSMIFKKDVPKRRAILLLLTEVISFAAYIVEKNLQINLSFSVMAYVFSEIIVLIIVRRLSIYNIRDNVADTIMSADKDGYISFDKRLKYIGCMGNAVSVFPELKKVRVDKKAKKNAFLNNEFLPFINEYRMNGSAMPRVIDRGEVIYKMTVDTMINGRKRAGYQIHIMDDTEDRLRIRELDMKVYEKTKDIRAMHDNLILSMATVVESRDNSTGGHVRRTSDCVRILIDEMKKDPECEIAKNDEFCRNLIKAAPMHDLGKIAVPDNILQKPGRFEDWEFEKMKTHAAEGARIVHEILKDMDKSGNDEYRRFHVLAENVAHYHHERMDGSGYPEGLVGDQIPVEARIMAIADVYDALVSKRVYKDRMSFEKADGIMMDSFGKHFDPQFEKYYVAAKPRLEAYYTAEEESDEETA